MRELTEETLWNIRAFVYRHFADTTRAPSVDETAATFALTHEQAASAYEALHARHAFFLRPSSHEILMANPFSNTETTFRVHANGQTYFANCAWDSLGIPAAPIIIIQLATITCLATRVHNGRTTQIWDATVTDETSGKTLALFRCTQLMIYPREK